MTAAWAYVRLRERRPPEQLARVALGVAPFAVLGLGASAYLFGHEAALAGGPTGPSVARTTPLIPAFYTVALMIAMLVVLLGPKLLQLPFANRLIARLAELSYGVFLIHLVAAFYLGDMVLDLPRNGTLADTALWFAVVLAASLAYAYLSLRFVERPARDWARGHMAGDGGDRALEAPGAAAPAELTPTR